MKPYHRTAPQLHPSDVEHAIDDLEVADPRCNSTLGKPALTNIESKQWQPVCSPSSDRRIQKSAAKVSLEVHSI